MAQDNPFAEFLTPKEDDNPFAEFLPSNKPKTLGDSVPPSYLLRDKSAVVQGGYVPENVIAPSTFVPANIIPKTGPLNDGTQAVDDWYKNPETGKIRETRISSGSGVQGDPFVVSGAFDFDDVYDAAPHGAVFLKPDGTVVERKASPGEMFAEPFQSGLETLIGGTSRIAGDFLNAPNEMREALTNPNYKQLKEGYPASSLPYESVGSQFLKQLAPLNFGDPLNKGADAWLASADQRMSDVTAGTTPLRGSLGDMTGQLVESPGSVARHYGPQAVRSLPAMLGAMTGNPAAAAGIAGGVTSVETYGQDRKAGMGVGVSALDAGIQGTIETVAEKLPFDEVFSASINPFKKALKVAATETATEGMTGPSQYIAGQGVRGEAIDNTQLQNSFVDSLAAGLAMSGPMAGAGLGVDIAAGNNRTQVDPPNKPTEPPSVTAPVTAPVAQGNRGSVVPPNAPNAPIVDPSGLDAAISGAPVATLGTSPPVTVATDGISQPQSTAPAQVEPTDDLDALLAPILAKTQPTLGATNDAGRYEQPNTNAEANTGGATNTQADIWNTANPDAKTNSRPAPDTQTQAANRQAGAISRLTELEAKSDSGPLLPDEANEYVQLLKQDRTAGKVGGRVMPGVRNSTAYTQAKDAGQLKPVQTFLDADNFKRINDELNHNAGDEAIAQIGQALFDEIGEGNVFHRSGDEFIVQGDDPAVIDAAMTRARDRLAKAKLQVTLPDGTVIERTGIGFSYGSGKDITEAENAQRTDKENRAAAGLRTERRADSRRVDTGADKTPVTGRPQEGQGASNTAAKSGRRYVQKVVKGKPVTRPGKNGKPVAVMVPTIDYKNDTLLHWLSAAGGINFDNVGKQIGIDKALFKDRLNRPFGIGFPVLRRNGGMTLDDIYEKMKEDGWLLPDSETGQSRDDASAMEDMLMDALAGRPVYHPFESRADRDTETQTARQEEPSNFATEDELAQEEGFENANERRAFDLYVATSLDREQDIDADRYEEIYEAARKIEYGTDTERARTGEANSGRVEEDSQGLFAQATAQESVKAEREKRDAGRNGLGRDLVNPSQGDGELFAGNAPEQGSFDSKVESTNDMFVRTRGDREVQNENADSKNKSTGGLDAESVQPRVDASPALVRRGKYEIESLVRRFGGSVLADTIARDFRETEASILIGKKVKNAADLAAIADVYRNPLFETLRYIFVDDKGKIVGETAISSRLPTSAVSHPYEIDPRDWPDWIDQDARAAGAKGFWMIHNHPSGNPMPSGADMRVTSHVNKNARTKLLGHIVLNHAKYGELGADGTFVGISEIPNKAASDPLREVRGMVLDATISSPATAASVGKQLFDSTPENSAAVLAVGADGTVRAAMTFPRSVLSTLRFAAAMSALSKRAGSAMNVIVLPRSVYKAHFYALNKMADAGVFIDIMVVDADGKMESLSGRNAITGADTNKFLGRRGRDERGKVVREDTLLYLQNEEYEKPGRKTPQQAEQESDTRRNDAAQTLPVDRGTVGWNYKANRWDGRLGELRNARAELQDKMISWRYVQEDMQKAIPDAENVYRMETLMHGRVALQMDTLERESIIPLIDAMRKDGVKAETLEQYLYARHAQERNEQIASINQKMPDYGSGMGTDEANVIITNADPKVKALARMVDVITAKTRRRLLDNGLITQEQFEAMRDQYNFYVPLRGKKTAANDFDADMRRGVGGGGIDTRGSVLKKAMGRGKGNLAENVLAEIIGDAQRSIILAEKARVGRAAMRAVLANPNPDLWQVEPVQTERKLDDSGEVYEAIVNDMSDPRIVAVRHKGQLYKISIADEQLAKALNHVGTEQLGAVTRLLGKVNRYFSAVLTQYNPAFIPVNASRDALFGLTALAAEKGETAALKSVYRYAPAMVSAMRFSMGKNGNSTWDKWVKEFAEAGGMTGYVNMPSVEEISKAFGSGKLGGYSPTGIAKVGRVIADIVGAMNSAVENALRLSAYVTLRKDGESQEAAAEYAKNLTVNFNRKGFQGSKLNSWFLFYNASLQGAVRSSKVMRKPKTWAYLGALTAVQIMSTIFAMSLADDDDEPLANKIPDHVKRRNLWFVIPGDQGEHTLVTVPLPYGFNVFPYMAGRVAQANMNKEKKSEDTPSALAASTLSALFESFFPVPLSEGPKAALPYPVQILSNVQNNKDDFGRPIRTEDPYAKSDVPLASMGKPDTLEVFKITAKGLNRVGGGTDEKPPALSWFDTAPEDLEYLTKAVTGGLGKFVIDMAGMAGNLSDEAAPELGPEGFPIIKRYVSEINDPQAQRAMFYDRRAAIDLSLKRVRKEYKASGAEAAQALLAATPELKGARFDTRKNASKDGTHEAGSVVESSDGTPKIEAGRMNSPYFYFKRTEKIMQSNRDAIEAAYLSAPSSIFPNAATRKRDAEIRRLYVLADGNINQFNTSWNREVVNDEK